MKVLLAPVLLLLFGVSASGQDLAVADDPLQRVAQLEARLLAAKRVAIEASIESSGFISSKLKGRSELQDRNRANLSYTGEFGGKPAELSLIADGRALELRGGAQTRREALGRESNRALLIGFVRIGLLHTLARLALPQGPDHGAGGVEQWVVLDAFRPTTYAQEGDLVGATSVGFDLLIDGQTAGSARLWFDPASGLPRRRVLTLFRPEGDTTVVEDYTRFVVE